MNWILWFWNDDSRRPYALYRGTLTVVRRGAGGIVAPDTGGLTDVARRGVALVATGETDGLTEAERR